MSENNGHTPRLPRELWREITSFLADNPPGLLSASLASHTLRDEAQHILFRHPSKILSRATYTMEKYPLFIDAILSSPGRLGRLVKTYTHDRRRDPDPGYLEKVNSALRSMINLKRLAFPGTDLPSSILHGCTFQLQAFYWVHADTMEILRDFLPTQPSLKHLTFPCYGEIASEDIKALAKSVCPKLESLTGSRATIDLFLKGRQVIYLQWGSDHSDFGDTFIESPPANHEPLEGLDTELAEIQYLTFIPSWASQLPSELLEKLQSLILLEAPVQAIGGKDNLMLLSKLSTLRVLILHDSMIGSDVAPLELVREILTCCRHLLYIDIEIRRLVYQRFTQASLASTPMQGPILTGIGLDTPYSSPYVHKFTTISTFDGIDRFSTLGGINFQRDFAQWFDVEQDYDPSSMFSPNDINFERDFGQWFAPGPDMNGI